ncbi:MAG: phosphoenolpyruvate synthase, partial [Patescibacteria group bacterium]
MKKHIYWFKELTIKDVPLVGGKNAALGEMYQELIPLGVKIPNGFAVSAQAFRDFIKFNNLSGKINQVLKGLDTHNVAQLAEKGKAVRQLILSGEFPEDLKKEIIKFYRQLSKQYQAENVDVAVRSSATAEDLPGASFAGQQETYLNIRGGKALLEATKKCFASLFTDRAISYRVDKGFDQTSVALSVGIQKMVRADKASSGVAFTLDTETGFNQVIVINSVYGLGELIVQGKVIPDEFIVFKPPLANGFYPIIEHRLGDKNIKMIYGSARLTASSGSQTKGKPTKVVPVPIKDKNKFSLSDKEAIKLAEDCLKIEQHFSKKHKKYTPMDIEWAKDGLTNEVYIVQARPETVHAGKKENIYEEHILVSKPAKPLLTGIAIGTKIVAGKVRVIKNVKDIYQFKKGEVLVTEITDPDWEPIMKIASGIITDKGGRTSHAAIVSRELGVPCLVGSQNATKALKTGQTVTLDCSSGEQGKIYSGALKYKVLKHNLKNLPKLKTKISLNIGAPDEAFRYHALPVDGVGLGRLEFIIASEIKAHPNALIDYEKLRSGKKTIHHHSSAEIKKIVR